MDTFDLIKKAIRDPLPFHNTLSADDLMLLQSARDRGPMGATYWALCLAIDLLSGSGKAAASSRKHLTEALAREKAQEVSDV